MKMAKLYDFAAERAHREQDVDAQLATYDELACPHCGLATKPFAVSAQHVVSYRCTRGHGWRINADGEMLRGLKSERFWP